MEAAWNMHVKDHPVLLDLPEDVYLAKKQYFVYGWEARKREELRRAYTPQQELKLG